MKASRETFAGRRREPELFGLERAALYPAAAAWTGAAMILTILRVRLGMSWTGATALVALPAITVTAASLHLIQGRPPGYFLDWLEEMLGRRNADGSTRKPRHPFNAP